MVFAALKSACYISPILYEYIRSLGLLSNAFYISSTDAITNRGGIYARTVQIQQIH